MGLPLPAQLEAPGVSPFTNLRLSGWTPFTKSANCEQKENKNGDFLEKTAYFSKHERMASFWGGLSPTFGVSQQIDLKLAKIRHKFAY